MGARDGRAAHGETAPLRAKFVWFGSPFPFWGITSEQKSASALPLRALILRAVLAEEIFNMPGWGGVSRLGAILFDRGRTAESKHGRGINNAATSSWARCLDGQWRKDWREGRAKRPGKERIDRRAESWS